jgi:MFS family permease
MYVPVPELSQRRRLLVLAIYCLSLLLVGMDVTIVNVALPSIRRDLQVSVSGLQWTIDAYVLILASLLMLGGSTADRIGRLTGLGAGGPFRPGWCSSPSAPCCAAWHPGWAG